MLQIVHNTGITSLYSLPDQQKVVDFQRKPELGQFMTSSQIAHFMASLFDHSKFRDIRLLDPGAGLGALSMAFLNANSLNNKRNKSEILNPKVSGFSTFRTLENFSKSEKLG